MLCLNISVPRRIAEQRSSMLKTDVSVKRDHRREIPDYMHLPIRVGVATSESKCAASHLVMRTTCHHPMIGKSLRLMSGASTHAHSEK